MLEISIMALAFAGLVVFIAGYKLGHAVGFNAGLQRAHEIMDQAGIK